MPTNRPHLTGWLGRAAVVAGVAGSLSVGALADVRTSTQTRSYSVGGTTATSLVSYMRSNPFHGARGDAVANIRPNYALSMVDQPDGRNLPGKQGDARTFAS